MIDYLTYYEILEIDETASEEEIKKAFRILSKEYHPDKIPDHLSKLKQVAEEKFKQINEAYQILSNLEKRRQYDEKLEELRDSYAKTSRENGASSTTSSVSIPKLGISPKSFNFSNIKVGSSVSGSFKIINLGNGILTGSISSTVPWIKIPASIPPTMKNQSQEIYLSVDASSLPYGFSGTGTVSIKTNGGNKSVSVNLATEGLSVLVSKFRSSYVPLIAAFFGFIGSFSRSPISDFLSGAFFSGIITYAFAKLIVKFLLNRSINVFKVPSILIQGVAIGIVIFAITVHSGDSRSLIKSAVTANPPQRQKVKSKAYQYKPPPIHYLQNGRYTQTNKKPSGKRIPPLAFEFLVESVDVTNDYIIFNIALRNLKNHIINFLSGNSTTQYYKAPYFIDGSNNKYEAINPPLRGEIEKYFFEPRGGGLGYKGTLKVRLPSYTTAHAKMVFPRMSNSPRHISLVVPGSNGWQSTLTINNIQLTSYEKLPTSNTSVSIFEPNSPTKDYISKKERNYTVPSSVTLKNDSSTLPKSFAPPSESLRSSIEDQILKEVTTSGRYAEYKIDDGMYVYRADHIGSNPQTQCQKIRLRAWESGSLIKDKIREICGVTKHETRSKSIGSSKGWSKARESVTYEDNNISPERRR